MGKAVKDNRPARAVLSAPYPLPIVITRSHSKVPITTSTSTPSPLPTNHDTPIVSVGLPSVTGYARTGGPSTLLRDEKSILTLRKKGKKPQRGKETDLDLISGVLEESRTPGWKTAQPLALDIPTPHEPELGKAGPSLTGPNSSLNRTNVEVLVGEMKEDVGEDLPGSDAGSLYSEEGDDNMEGDDESDATQKPWDRSMHHHVPRFRSLLSTHSRSARSSNVGGYISEATSTKTVIRIPRSRHARHSNTREPSEIARGRSQRVTRDKGKGRERARIPSISSRRSQAEPHDSHEQVGVSAEIETTHFESGGIQHPPSQSTSRHQLPFVPVVAIEEDEPLQTGIPMSIDTRYSLLQTGIAMSIDPLITGMPMSIDPRSSDIRLAGNGQPSGWPHPLNPREVIQAYTPARTTMPPPPIPTRQLDAHPHLPLVSPVYPLARGLRLPTAPPTRPGRGIIPIYKACHNAWLASKVEYTKRIKAAKAIEERNRQLQAALSLQHDNLAREGHAVDLAEAAVGLALMGKEDDGGSERDFGLNIAGPSGKVYTQPVSTIGIIPPGSTEMVWITPQQYLTLQQDRQGTSTSLQPVVTPNAHVRSQSHTPGSANPTPTSLILTTPATDNNSPIGQRVITPPRLELKQLIRAVSNIAHVASAEDDEPEYLGTKPARKRLRAISPSSHPNAATRPIFAMPTLPIRRTTSVIPTMNSVQGGNLPQGITSPEGGSGNQSALPPTSRPAQPAPPKPPGNSVQGHQSPHTPSPRLSAPPIQPQPLTPTPHLLSPAQISAQPRVRLGRPLPRLPPDLDFDLAPRTPRGHLLTEDIWDLTLTDAIAAESPLAMRLERDRRARHTEWVRQQRELTYDRLEKEERERKGLVGGGGRMGTVDMEGGRGASVRVKVEREETVVMEDVSGKVSGKGRKREEDDD